MTAASDHYPHSLNLIIIPFQDDLISDIHMHKIIVSQVLGKTS